MSVKKESRSLDIMFLELLFLLFLGLKLGNVITWSWIWVFAPIWIPLALVLIIFGLFGIVLVIEAVKVRNGNKKKTTKN